MSKWKGKHYKFWENNSFQFRELVFDLEYICMVLDLVLNFAIAANGALTSAVGLFASANPLRVALISLVGDGAKSGFGFGSQCRA
jgi:hypothetical protein